MNKNLIFQNIVTAVLATSALAVAAVLVHRELGASQQGAPVEIADWSRLAEREPDLGLPGASARMVLFSDYQCPYCRDLERKLAEVVDQHGGSPAVVRFELPLTQIHPQAFAAATAAKCAAEQGIRQPFQEALFDLDLAGNPDALSQAAIDAGVPDREAFTACMQGSTGADLVEADIAEAKRLGIDSVPALIVDGKLYTGTRDMDELEDILAPVL